MNSNRISSLATLVALAMLAGCTMMQAPQPDPTVEKLAELDRRLAALERILASGALTDLTVQVDELQRENADLRGRAESLEHDAESTAGRQRDLYVDLDNRIQNLEQGMQSRSALPVAQAGSAGVALSGGLPVPQGNDRSNYEAAFDLLKQQQYEAAGAAFSQFLASFPDSQLADNAQYWLAEASYVTDNFEQALAQFQVVLGSYPRSRKIPDALLKIGYSNYELGRWEGARSALEMVKNDYPDSTAARLADQRLSRMTDEGH